MSTSHLLYLHGFRSSPQSAKARQMAERMAADHPGVTWWCPQLPPSPAEAAALIDQGTKTWPSENMAIVGSSLGGFYATWLAQQRACRAVVLNPAVDPARDLTAYIGELRAWHNPAEQFFFRREYIDELRQLESGVIRHPERIYALIAKGDELLDWREMFSRYAACRIQLLEGGDHALSDFHLHLGQVLEFLRLQSA
ncbi:YqiA/YcfP family alpha/beta fold hydrolase [Ottowia thiooxydans]|uniref:Esterase YcpF (UPF0227 family) n=1 Tax=Ottowia thiooxydans TaxID=219182 RepID=A0ABV2QET8_9BURK